MHLKDNAPLACQLGRIVSSGGTSVLCQVPVGIQPEERCASESHAFTRGDFEANHGFQGREGEFWREKEVLVFNTPFSGWPSNFFCGWFFHYKRLKPKKCFFFFFYRGTEGPKPSTLSRIGHLGDQMHISCKSQSTQQNATLDLLDRKVITKHHETPRPWQPAGWLAHLPCRTGRLQS